MIAAPRLLVLDEPSGGLAPLVVDRILDVAASLCRESAAIILIEQLVESKRRGVGTLRRGLALRCSLVMDETAAWFRC